MTSRLVLTRALTAWETGLRSLAALPNVVCKLSGLVTEANWKTWTAADLERCLTVAWEAFGPERLLMGSDWPVCTLAAEYERAVGVTVDFLARFSTAERTAVLGGNAARIWRLGAHCNSSKELRTGTATT